MHNAARLVAADGSRRWCRRSSGKQGMLTSEAYDTNGFYDEMFDAARSPRPGCARVAAVLVSLPPTQLAELRARADRMFLRMGVTFNVYGDEAGTERIFPFDPVPRVIDGDTWAHIEAGLVQ